MTEIIFLLHYRLFVKRFSNFLWKLRLDFGSRTLFVDLPTFWRKTMHSSDADALSWREPTKGLSNKEKVILLTGILFLFHYKLFIKRFSYFFVKTQIRFRFVYLLCWFAYFLCGRLINKRMWSKISLALFFKFVVMFLGILVYDFWSKFQISFKFMYGQIERL